MKRFSTLFTELDGTTSTTAKVQALTRYFASVPPEDAAWAVYFLAGGKPRQVVKTATLRRAALSVADLPEWLFEECYQAVGDLAETIAHVLPAARQTSELGLAEWVEDRLLALRGLPEPEVVHRVKSYWDELDPQSRFLLTKLVGGGFRVGVSRLLVQRALAAHAGIDAKQVAQRMMGYTDGRHLPTPKAFAALIAAEVPGQTQRGDSGQPYPFFLAHPLDMPEPPDVLADADQASAWLANMNLRLGAPSAWQVEWKYDGIRGQLVKRAGQVWLWSRGEELVTERFPEIVALGLGLPDGVVLDGEIMAWIGEAPAPFALLQQRIGRKTLSKKVLADAPVIFMAYDLLEWQGQDVRTMAQSKRRELLEAALQASGFPVSPVEQLASWQDYALLRQSSRERGVEGFMLKHVDAAYGTGRSKAEGLWWKWKIEPMSVDCVLIYAQAGHGRRASLYTDYTFAVWNRPPASAEEADAVVEAIARRAPAASTVPDAPEPPLQLIAFAKAYSGLSDAEFKAVDAVIRKNTLEKFGPVRSVRPTLVFELGFEGINLSARHKSGIAVRFPRMLRPRPDKPLHEAGSLANLRLLLNIV
jgi:DNA ligase-1